MKKHKNIDIHIYIHTYMLRFKPSIRIGKKGDLSDFEHGMVVGARQAGLSISATADLLRFSRTTISRVGREWSKKEKISSERQFFGRKFLVDARGEWPDWLELIER